MTRPVHPTSYVTRLPDRRTWQGILAKYRAEGRTLGVTKPVPVKPVKERK